MSAPLPAVEIALNRWRSNLIDLSRRNPLLSLKPTGSAYLAILQPALDDLFAQLVRNRKPLRVRLPSESNAKAQPTKPDDLVTGEADRDRLLRILTNLHRRALADFRERGLQILYLALGVLDWRDADDEPARSPVLLLPVELRRQTLREPFALF